jgi:hypothetical protein
MRPNSLNHELIEKCRETFRFAEGQLRHLIETYPDVYPVADGLCGIGADIDRFVY